MTGIGDSPLRPKRACNKSVCSLFVGKPVPSRVTGIYILPLSRAYQHPDGSFAGVVVGALRLACASSLGVALTVTTRTGDLVEVLEWLLQPLRPLGVDPERLSLQLGLMLRFTEHFFIQWGKLDDAYRLRTGRGGGHPGRAAVAGVAQHLGEALGGRRIAAFVEGDDAHALGQDGFDAFAFQRHRGGGGLAAGTLHRLDFFQHDAQFRRHALRVFREARLYPGRHFMADRSDDELVAERKASIQPSIPRHIATHFGFAFF